MSLIFFDGCGEYYGTSEIGNVWVAAISAPTVGVGLGRNGGNCIVMDGVSDKILANAGLSSTLFVGFGMRWETVGNYVIFDARSGTGTQVRFELTAAGAITVDRGASTFLGTTPTGLITSQNYSYIEIKMVINNGAGEIIIKIDGIEQLNLTGENTNGHATNTTMDVLEFESHTEVDGVRIDDVYICDDQGSAPYNTFLGNSRIDVVFPDADGATTAIATTFPASPTDHFSKVDESESDGDTTYNESTVANQVDLFAYGALPSDPRPVLAVKGIMHGKKIETGPGTARMIARPSGANFNGAIKGFAEEYSYQNHIWLVNPQTGLEWTAAQIDAGQFGAEILS